MNIQSVRKSLANNPAKEPAFKVGVWVTTIPTVWTTADILFPSVISDKTYNIGLVIIAFFIPLVTSAFTRGKVWSPASVLDAIDEASASARTELNKAPRKPNDPPRVLP